MTNLKINTTKPFLVFAAPRCGTSMLMKIVKSYSKERFDISEYFNKDYVVFDNNIKLRSELKYDIEFEINERIRLLEKYADRKIPIKILSNQMTDDIFNYVKNRYTFILVERNRYDQLLSWLIAMHTDIWNTEGEVSYPSKFVVDLNQIDRFFELFTTYQKWKDKFSNTITIQYEDMNSEDNYKKIIEQLRFTYDNRPILYPLTKLYSLSEKEKIIINIDEIKEYVNRKRYEIFN